MSARGDVGPPDASPDIVIDVRTDAERVAAAVAALGPLDREALVLRVRGRSLEHVAAATGTTVPMVRVRLHRAALAVEARVGPLPSTPHEVVVDDGRDTDEVVVDAEVGITPMLHARLVGALASASDPRPPRFRRVRQFVRTLVDEGPQLTVFAAALAAIALATLAPGLA